MARTPCRCLPAVGVAMWGALLGAPTPSHAQTRQTSLWIAGRADLVGLPGPSGSPALLGLDVRLLHRVSTSPWSIGLVLSMAGRTKGATPEPYVAGTYGLYAEVDYTLGTWAVQPYVLGSLGLANTRIDDNYPFPGGIVLNVGGDATTGVVGGGVGVRMRRLGGEAFLDAQYQRRTNPAHGGHALPIRLGFRF